MSRPLLYLSRAYLIRYAVLLLLCSGKESYANIHKCVSNEGVEYSDTHCSIGILVKHSPVYRTMGSIEGLSSLELENLDKLEQAYKKSSLASERQRSAQKKQMVRARARERQDRARACAKAIQGLERMRLIKRRGYSAKQSRALNAQQNLLNEKKHSNC